MESKYYPPAILLIFSLMMGPRISMILGLLIGYAESYGFFDRVLPGLNTTLIWEQKNSIKPMTTMKGKFHKVKTTLCIGFVKASGSADSVGFIQPA